MFRLVTSPAASARLAAAEHFLQQFPASSEVVIVSASRGAGDDFARRLAQSRRATFGLSRFSLVELAARLASHAVGGRRTPAGQAGSEAVAMRAAFDAQTAGELSYFGPVAGLPGFPRALARTLHELRLADVSSADLTGSDGRPPAVRDIGRLLARVETYLDEAGVDDRPALFRLAAEGCQAARSRWVGVPLLLLDLAADSHMELAFIGELVRRAPEVLATVPDGDDRFVRELVALGAVSEQAADQALPATDLFHLRRNVFAIEPPAVRTPAGDVCLFSAPGEGREAIEIVRRILNEAKRGVPFDEMAVLLRSPRQYLGLLEHAFARAGVPAYFDRGTRRPDPAGRAFIALLSSAVEGLSAKRFDEYLSLGQVPRLDRQRRTTPIVPRDEALSALAADESADDPETAPYEPPEHDSDEDAIVAGTLRSPWKWEELIVESAVVGGRNRSDGRERWRRRLKGLSNDYRLRLRQLKREEADSPRVARLERDLRNLEHLRRFALPIIDELADWPAGTSWGEWLDRFVALAGRALYRPDRVLKTLADLRPMADVGPVSLEEARDVLRDRLVLLDWDPPASRYGRVFVGTPHQARGRVFRVVFVPGLAERVVPQRPREDPLLLDDRRRGVEPSLMDQERRGAAERLLLRLAIGAARERLYLSYPRMDVAETRARVPSFYALDVMRAISGRVPDHRVLAAEAAEEGGVTLGWPAPRDPRVAIDDLEHDLAVLKPLLESRDSSARGRAHYILGLNESLKRSITALWSRERAKWSPSDGLIRVTPEIERAVTANRLANRPYSTSALQRFASCPYQFLLSTIHRLEPWDEPQPLLRMDPLTRGSFFHEVQATLLRELQAGHALPVTAASVPAAVRLMTEVLARVAADYAEKLAPAIDRVWKDEVAELARDLAIWVRKMADEKHWVPEYFEFSFGLSDEGRDPRSLKSPVLVDDRFLLRGSVDLVERRADGTALRVTDHKTGKDRSKRDMVVDGGKVLQPVLYSAVIERALGTTVEEGRLFFCTTAGGFADHRIVLDDYRRQQGLQVLTIIDRAVERGFLPAAPSDGACRWCDFGAVCGPREEERVKGKNRQDLADLEALRAMR